MTFAGWRVAGAVIAACVVGCGSTCELDPAQREIAGASATFCGRVALGADRAASRQCAIDAVRAGRAFWVAWQGMGIDSEVWSGFAQAPDGTAYSFLWDGDPSGGSDLGARTQRVRCARLTVTTIDGQDEVICEPSGAPLETVCRE